MRLTPILLSLCIGFVSSALGCLTPIQEEAWVVVKTPNFEIASSMTAEKTTKLATDLERFRALVFTITSAPEGDSPVPTQIVAFDRAGEFMDFRPNSKISGYFIPGLRSNHVALADMSRRQNVGEIIFHEYVHFVMRNGTQDPYPLWYDEGFAEVLSTAQVYKGKLVVGAIPKSRIDWFQYGEWLPFEKVLKAQSYEELTGQKLGMFYAQAWVLAHYVTLDIPRASKGSLNQYMSLVKRGRAPEAAYRSAFGESLDRSGLKIRKLLQNGNLKLLGIPLENIEYDKTPPVVRTPSEAEIAIRLGQLQLRRGEGEKAQVLFEAALAAEPMNAHANAGMGDALKFQDMYDEAESYFRRAVEIAPKDALCRLDLAEYLHDLARKKPRGAERQELLKAAREEYAVSSQLDSGIPEAQLMYGRTFLEPGEDPAQSVAAIEHTYRKLPSLELVMTTLAESYLANDREGEARKILQRLIGSTHAGSLYADINEAVAAIRKERKEALAKLNEMGQE